MFTLLVLTIALGIASADVGLGYHYKVPQTSYGVPSYQIGGNSGSNYNTGYSGVGGSNGYNYKGQSGYQGVKTGQQNVGSQAGYTGYQSGAAAGTDRLGGSSGAGTQYYTSQSTGSNVVSDTLVQPTHQSGIYAGQSGYQSGVNAGQSGYQSGITAGQSGYQAGVNKGQTGVNKGQTGYQSGIYTGQTGYQSGVNAGQTGYQSGVNSGQTGYQSGVNSGQTGYQSGVNAGQLGYQSGVNAGQTRYQGGVNAGQSGNKAGGNAGQYAYQTYNQYQTASQYDQKYQVQYQQQPAQVFKHYYVHAAPEEAQQVRPRNPVVLPAPQKHYKIIFIKTPSQYAGGPQIVPVQQQNEEKTIVYVLVKKPEDYQDIEAPKVEQKPPSKPEVYFIKYNSKEDSQHVINNIVNDYNIKGQSASGVSGNVASDSYVDQAVIGSGVSATGAYSGQSNSGSSGSYSGQSNSGSSGSYSGQSNLGSTGSYSDQSNIGSGASYLDQSNLGSSLTTVVSQPEQSSFIGLHATQSDTGSTGSSEGSYSNQANEGAGHAALGQSESQLLQTFGSTFGQATNNQKDHQGTSNYGQSYASGSSGAASVASVESTGALSDGYGSSSTSSAFSTSTVNYDNGNGIATSQGVPHETYGIPKFTSN